MYPILFKFGPLTVYSYGLSVALALIIGTFLAKRQAQRKGVAPEKILNLCLGLAISGVLGARLLYVLQNLGFYLRFPGQIFMLHKGGLSFYGGFILAVIFAVFYLRRQRLSILSTFDIVCPYLALAHAIGRIGCFFNGCCFGKPTDSFFRVYFPGQNLARVPVQLYSCLGLLLIFVILRILQSKVGQHDFPGRIFIFYCLLYSLLRFGIEFLRGDNLAVWGNLTFHQLISITVFLISGVIWWRLKTSAANSA